MNKVKNIRELCQMSQEKLKEILGNAANAKLLWEFIHNNHKLDATRKWTYKVGSLFSYGWSSVLATSYIGL